MYFLVDYENVNYIGLEGTEYLNANDTLIVFYSKNCNKILSYRMKQIINSECKFEVCKLVSKGKNALDFYIATKVGEIFAVDQKAQVAIISHDKGFQALIDYWKLKKNRILRSGNIAKAMESDVEHSRRLLLQQEMLSLDIKSEYELYLKQNAIKKACNELFEGTLYESLDVQIAQLVINNLQTKRLYVETLKAFGRLKGLEIYRTIKPVFVDKFESDLCEEYVS